MRQFILVSEVTQSEILPNQAAGSQILSAVAENFEKCVIHLGNLVELARSDTGNGRPRGR
jgi:hypothetical protein